MNDTGWLNPSAHDGGWGSQGGRCYTQNGYGVYLYSRIGAVFHDFNASIPDASIIKGIEMKVRARQFGNAGSHFIDKYSLAFNGLEDSATSHGSAGQAAIAFGTSYTDGSVGGSSFLYGLPSISVSDVNSSGFGVYLHSYYIGGRSLDVDWVTIKIYYEELPQITTVGVIG